MMLGGIDYSKVETSKLYTLTAAIKQELQRIQAEIDTREALPEFTISFDRQAGENLQAWEARLQAVDVNALSHEKLDQYLAAAVRLQKESQWAQASEQIAAEAEPNLQNNFCTTRNNCPAEVTGDPIPNPCFCPSVLKWVAVCGLKHQSAATLSKLIVETHQQKLNKRLAQIYQ